MAIKIQTVDHTKVLVTVECKDSMEAERVSVQIAQDLNDGKFLPFLDHEEPSSAVRDEKIESKLEAVKPKEDKPAKEVK